VIAADRCSGCGAALPDDPNSPHHRYMTASSGCWQAFGEILAAEFGRPGWGREHRRDEHATVRGWADAALRAAGRA
jgi:hypothetical protein